jgi:hypothetical protein
MKNLGKISIGALLTLAVMSAQAQEEMPVLPVDMWGCNFSDGADMADLDRAFDDYNEWADAAGITNVTIYQLSPTFFSGDMEYDFLGMNIWPDGAAFGSGNDAMENDADSLAMFQDVFECDVHALYALVGVKPPAQNMEPPGLWEFSNCTMHGNRSNDEGIAAVAAAAEIFARYDLNDAHAALFNIAGHPSDANYNFKWVTAYPSYGSWGSLFDGLTGDGGVQELNALMSPVMQCDSARIYSMTVRRTAAAE